MIWKQMQMNDDLILITSIRYYNEMHEFYFRQILSAFLREL